MDRGDQSALIEFELGSRIPKSTMELRRGSGGGFECYLISVVEILFSFDRTL